MPVGIPKVPLFLEEDEPPIWVEVYQALFEDKIFLLFNDLKREIINQLMGALFFLDKTENKDNVVIYINSGGGSLYYGIAVYDAINQVNFDVTTIGCGQVASTAALILLGGTPGKRLSFQNCRMMIHQPVSSFTGQASHVQLEKLEVTRTRHNMISIISARTGQSFSRIKMDVERDFWLNPDQAKEYGLIDQIITDSFDIYEYLNFK